MCLLQREEETLVKEKVDWTEWQSTVCRSHTELGLLLKICIFNVLCSLQNHLKSSLPLTLSILKYNHNLLLRCFRRIHRCSAMEHFMHLSYFRLLVH